MEQKGPGYHQKVREGFLELSEKPQGLRRHRRDNRILKPSTKKFFRQSSKFKTDVTERNILSG